MSDPSHEAKRPLSPHLQVYRLPYNALMSISGRAVGIGLAMALMAVLVWFNAVVWNPSIYDQSMALLADHSWSKYIFFVWAFAIFFYIGNGVRHVLWSMGIGVNQKAGITTGNIVLLLSVLLTAGLWQFTCGCWAPQLTEQPQIEGAANVE